MFILPNPIIIPNLTFQTITSLVSVADELKSAGSGRPATLKNSSVIAMLVVGTLKLKTRTFKAIYEFFAEYHARDIKLPNYQNFIKHCHRIGNILSWLLTRTLNNLAKLRFVDSTMLQVCRKVRADRHKVARGIAAFGKNHQGWHYSFKLHAAVDENRQICAITFTPANTYDAQVLPQLAKGSAKILVGDGGYTARVMREKLWKTRGVFVLAPPHFRQKTKLIADWQLSLLKARPKIEAAFGILKEDLQLVSSFPRSVTGYLVHYLRVLLAYQIWMLCL